MITTHTTRQLIIEQVSDTRVTVIGRTHIVERAEQIKAAARARITRGSSDWIRIREA